MTDTDFIAAMQLGLPKITPPDALSATEYRMDGLLLGNADIAINNRESVNGLCAEELPDEH